MICVRLSTCNVFTRYVKIRSWRRWAIGLRNGWAVWDTQTNSPAVVNGCWQVDLEMENADDLTDLLNRANPDPSKPQ